MTDRSDSESPAGQAPTGKKPEERELRGRYVEGSYGKAGVQRGRRAEDEEGQYIEGDYGAAGREGGLPEPLGEKAKESGRYVRADYGDAGAVPGRSAGSEIGQYAEGDYGADGTVGPLREAATGTSSEMPASRIQKVLARTRTKSSPRRPQLELIVIEPNAALTSIGSLARR